MDLTWHHVTCNAKDKLQRNKFRANIQILFRTSNFSPHIDIQKSPYFSHATALLKITKICVFDDVGKVKIFQRVCSYKINHSVTTPQAFKLRHLVLKDAQLLSPTWVDPILSLSKNAFLNNSHNHWIIGNYGKNSHF